MKTFGPVRLILKRPGIKKAIILTQFLAPLHI